MKSYSFLSKIPKNWLEVSREELEGLGVFENEEYKLIGAYFANEQIIFFHEYPEIPDFLDELKEAYLDLFIHDKTSQKSEVMDSVLVELGEFNGQKFLFYVSNIEGGNKLSLQIFCQVENKNFGVVTAIDFEKSLNFEKITNISHVNQILKLFT